MGALKPLTRSPIASAISDAEALERVAKGDVGSLGVLYDRHAESVHRFVLRATNGAEDVDDLVQNTFLAAAGAAARFDGALPCRPWLLGIANKLLSRRYRTLTRWTRLLTRAASSRTAAHDPAARADARRDIDRALAELSEAKRITFLLSEVEQLSGDEIASALAIPIGTVWTRLHAARRELRALLKMDEVSP